ncbi:MAG: tetratricopeptide repeat protein [Hyphomicrobiales bacterium]|nr:tetratricopeptide repeat protein [Alphaproteobacteria bacterium]
MANPPPNNPRGPAAVDAALARAKTALDQGRASEAEQLARTVLAKDARHAHALRLLGGALLLQERHAEAIEPLERAAKVLREPGLDTQLAIALRTVGRTDDALSRLKRAIKREPPYAFAFHELGFLLNALHRHDEAIATIRRGIEIAPLASNLWVLLGSIYHARRDLQGAQAAFARALTISPNLASAHYGIGTALMSQAAFARAAEHFRIASINDPGDLQARLKLAGCLLETGQTDTALASLRTVVRGGPQEVYAMSLKLMLSTGRGRFWLRPSAAARALS